MPAVTKLEKIKKAISLSKEATESLERALGAQLIPSAKVEMPLGAARSYLEEVYGILEEIREEEICKKEKS